MVLVLKIDGFGIEDKCRRHDRIIANKIPPSKTPKG
jgi:hypothetical protein